jgi:hypothetical protein
MGREREETVKTLGIAVVLLAVVLSLSGQVSFTVSTDLDKVMTPQEMKEFGVDKWTPKQKRDFHAFLRRYALSVANALAEAVK